MEHVLIQVVYDCFQLGLSLLRWIFITHSRFQNIEIDKLLVWKTKDQRWKWNLRWCVCNCVCVFVCVCVCDKTRVLLRKYWLVCSNPRGTVRISLYIGKSPVVHKEKHSHPNRYISVWQVYTNDANYLFPCNAMASF